MRGATWMNTRTALGTCLVLAAVLAGAVFLDRAQRLVPVYAAAHDLPAGATLTHGDLVVVRVRLPTSALRHYLQPTPGQTVAGRVLAAPVRQETLVPAELLLASDRDADLVELPVQADPGDMAQGLRPGDRIQVLAAYTEGARRGHATVLLPAAEVVRVLEDPGGLTGGGRPTGVQLRMPSASVPLVASAIATARIFLVKVPTQTATPPLTDVTEPPTDDAPPTTLTP
ncbi:MAG TPA: SAF domain-containing protein [Actinomycetota bacterium]|nr:SAF domain-containing protein [Actinomycetota bacterium]